MRRAVAVLSFLLLAGCLPFMTLRTGQPIGEDVVKGLTPGTTTKRELFERFGPPAAVVARAEVAVVPAPSVYGGSWSGTYGVDTNTFYELFPASGEGREYRRIYYYRHVESRKIGYFMILAVYESGETTADGLWVLVDERTGRVEDYAFRKSGAAVVFGVTPRPRWPGSPAGTGGPFEPAAARTPTGSGGIPYSGGPGQTVVRPGVSR